MKKVFKIIVSCVIMISVLVIIVKANNDGFLEKQVTIGEESFNIIPGTIALHFHIADYRAVEGKKYENTLKGPLIEEVTKTMQGYGKYHMQMIYNLADFLEYFSIDTNKRTFIENQIEAEGRTYEEIISLGGTRNYGEETKIVINRLWEKLAEEYGPEFDNKQDEYIANKYIVPAINRLNLSDDEYKDMFEHEGNFSLELSNINGESQKSIMTALLTSVMSEYWTADMNEIEEIRIGKADLIPFLYNIDETGHNIEDIAKYAYIAYIEGFLTAGRTDGFHYWEQEYEIVMGEEYIVSEEEIENLRIKFERAREVLGHDKGEKGNRLLGSTIEEVIQSEYNVSTQKEQVKNIIKGILGDIKDTEGNIIDYKEAIARNYLMVKHMMNNEKIENEIKEYCEGIVFNESMLSQGQSIMYDKNGVFSNYREFNDKREPIFEIDYHYEKGKKEIHIHEWVNGNRQKSRPITITEKKKYKHLFKGV